METKICRICGEEKPITDFPKNKQYKDGYDTRCRCCISVLQKANYHARKITPKGGGNPALPTSRHASLSRSFAQEATREHSNLRKQ